MSFDVAPPLLFFTGSAVVMLLSGLVAVAPFIPPRFAQRFAAFLVVTSSIVGFCSALALLVTRTAITWELNIPLPFGPPLMGIDPVTTFFCLPILIVCGASSLYGVGYYPAADDPVRRRKLTLALGVLSGSMIMVTMARSTGTFILFWELMALAAFFALTTDDHDRNVRDAGILYMICTHSSTLLLFLAFALLNAVTGSYAFPAAGTVDAQSISGTFLFLAALLGFGFKAGMMPLHVWLPSAHANAPSHVSAIMSGVILKIGIYGLVRFLTFFRGIPLWWGGVILILGVVSGIAGVLFAIGQHDLKRLLAYHSIENIGIILMGIGLFLLGVTTGSPLLATLGAAGGILHVLNHATFKSLLFLAAGSVIHVCGTRQIDRMGGIMKHLPVTTAAFLTGAVAICGLPPLNGFVSEFLVYLGLFRGVTTHAAPVSILTAISAPALALIGALAVACFVKVFGIVFLGEPREPLHHPHEAPRTMRWPMITLASVCIVIGIGALMLPPLLDPLTATLLPSSLPLSHEAPLEMVSAGAVTLTLLVVALFVTYQIRAARLPEDRGPTWGCGYLAPSPRMQYTASSFAQLLVTLFSGILRTSIHLPRIRQVLPEQSRFSSHVPEAVLDLVVEPALERLNERMVPIRRLQSGLLQQYVLYILITIMAIFAIGLF